MLTCQQHLFSLDPHFHYLNCAYMSPLLQSVEQVGVAAMLRKRQPHLVKSADFFSESQTLRSYFAQLVRAETPDRIAIIPSVSYGMANVAQNLRVQASQKIVIAHEQFPSNVYVWQALAERQYLRLQIVQPPDQTTDRGKIWNERILESIDNQTAVVALGNVHWADGTKFDLVQIGQRCREVGAKLIIDGTQSVGALDFDIQAIRPDALVCGGYKFLMSPYSIGVAYYGEYFDEGTPIEQNWITRHNSEDFAGLVNYQSDYQAKAVRYDVGERSNFILVPMFVEALRQLLVWQVSAIQGYCQELISPMLPILREKGYWIEDAEWRGSHLFGIRIPKHLTVSQIQTKLQERNISVSVRGSAIRVSPHVYNTPQNITALTEALCEISR